MIINIPIVQKWYSLDKYVRSTCHELADCRNGDRFFKGSYQDFFFFSSRYLSRNWMTVPSWDFKIIMPSLGY